MKGKRLWDEEGMLTDVDGDEEDKAGVVSPTSPTSISRHSPAPSAPPCTLYPRSYTLSLRSPWEQESSLSFPGISSPLLQSRPVNAGPSSQPPTILPPVPAANPRMNAVSCEPGVVSLTRLIWPREHILCCFVVFNP